MSFNWVEFLTLAEALLHDPNSPGPEEASLRSAISRAYYASHCSARNLVLAEKEIVLTGTGRDHRLVINHFRKSRDQTRQKIGTDLDRLRDNRNKADYDDLVSQPLALAQLSVTVARSVLNALNSL